VAGSERCVVLLRGINVGRGNRLAMADLRAALEAAGCEEVSTYLQSGNAFVTAPLEGLAARVEAALPLRVPVVVRTVADVAAVAAACPWPERAAAEPKQVHVAFLAGPPRAGAVARLAAAAGEQDELVEGDRALYLSFRGPSVDAPLAKALGKADLGTVVTTRNWTTVLRLSRPG
jgi:uncharacterized protein (DUF1697 family)